MDENPDAKSLTIFSRTGNTALVEIKFVKEEK